MGIPVAPEIAQYNERQDPIQLLRPCVGLRGLYRFGEDAVLDLHALLAHKELGVVCSDPGQIIWLYAIHIHGQQPQDGKQQWHRAKEKARVQRRKQRKRRRGRALIPKQHKKATGRTLRRRRSSATRQAHLRDMGVTRSTALTADTLRHLLGTDPFRRSMERRRSELGVPSVQQRAAEVTAAVAAATTPQQYHTARQIVWARYAPAQLRFALDFARARMVFNHRLRRERAFATCMRMLCAGSMVSHNVFVFGDGACSGHRAMVPTMSFYRFISRHALVLLVNEAHTSRLSACCGCCVSRTKGTRNRGNTCLRAPGQPVQHSAANAVRVALGRPPLVHDQAAACGLTLNRDASAAVCILGMALSLCEIIAKGHKDVLKDLRMEARTAMSFHAAGGGVGAPEGARP